MAFLKTRMNRTTYWTCMVLVFALGLFTAFVLEKKSGYVSEVILVLICLPRIHDLGKSGWIIGGTLIAYLIIVISIVSTLDLDTAQIWLGTLNLFIVAMLIWLGMLPGQPIANAYGEPTQPGISFRKSKPKS
jgi:uncharacterized membrane protein YhaH (DUF805 family)